MAAAQLVWSLVSLVHVEFAHADVAHVSVLVLEALSDIRILFG